MSRPIEYRAWVKDLQEYRKVAAIHYVIVNGIKVSHVELFGKTFVDRDITRSFRDVVLEQFTGFKDKNGKKIYEGDIVSISGEYASVVFDETRGSFMGRFFIVRDGREMECDADDYIFDFCPDNIEVIGNIHENPELLGEDTDVLGRVEDD